MISLFQFSVGSLVLLILISLGWYWKYLRGTNPKLSRDHLKNIRVFDTNWILTFCGSPSDISVVGDGVVWRYVGHKAVSVAPRDCKYLSDLQYDIFYRWEKHPDHTFPFVIEDCRTQHLTEEEFAELHTADWDLLMRMMVYLDGVGSELSFDFLKASVTHEQLISATFKHTSGNHLKYQNFDGTFDITYGSSQ